MKSLNTLWLKVLDEYGNLCHVSTTEDRKTFLRRVNHEGMEFLTITLPQLGKDLERALANEGTHLDDLFVGWRRTSFTSPKEEGRKSAIHTQTSTYPLFLGGFFGLVFDSVDGLLLDEPNVDAIIAIRQLSLMYGKLLVPCSDARVKKAIDGYIETEHEIRRNDANLESIYMEIGPGVIQSRLEVFRKASLTMFGAVLQQVDEDIYNYRITPKHGPGATADRLVGNSKYDQVQWTERLEQIFPYGENALPNWRYHSAYSRVEFLEPGAEKPVRVITVPKTAKTPRIIAIEPTCMQYMQQGLMAKFVKYLEARVVGPHRGNRNHAYGYVGFSDQEPNQLLAQEGSLTGDLATLDLSEASDRVSWLLVKTLCSSFPNLAEGVAATRSRRADVPGHGVIRLAKFASMGSALTFPVEAMVFATVAMIGIAQANGVPVTAELCEEYRGRVRVYGDDIIVPVDHVAEVVSALELFGFKVNDNKSFWSGNFRESCGKEYFGGHDVSVVRCRRLFPTQLHHTEEIMSLISLRNQLYQAGLWDTVGWLDKIIEKLLQGNFPVVEPTSPVLGRESVSFGYEVQKMHRSLHAPLVRGYVPKAVKSRSEISGLGALVKCLLNRGVKPNADEEHPVDAWWAHLDINNVDVDHLRHGGRPKSVDIRLRWGSPF